MVAAESYSNLYLPELFAFCFFCFFFPFSEMFVFCAARLPILNNINQ